MQRQKKTGPKAGFLSAKPITWQERRGRQQRQRGRQQRRREQQQRRREQRRRQREQQRRQRGRQERELPRRGQQPRERGLLLFCRKRSEKQPAGQRTERSISLGIPLTKLINPLINWRVCDAPIDAKILANKF
jgi:hypothetical protein